MTIYPIVIHNPPLAKSLTYSELFVKL